MISSTRKALLLSISILLAFLNSPNAQPVTNAATEGEKALIPYLKENRAAPTGITDPPASPVRTMAEWEEIQALVITWASHFPILSEIVRHAKEECEVIIICSSESSVVSYLGNNGIDTNNVTCIEAPFNTIWARDYAQWTAYTDDVDSLVLIDWIYNRPRPRDDTISSVIARHLDYPLYEMVQAPYDLVHTGGNFMVDGFGIGFSSNLVLNENWNGSFNITNKDEEQIDDLMNQFMGINEFVKMEVLPFDGIHHIDMHLKLLDEETLLMGEYPENIADGPQIEANLQYVLSNFQSHFGDPFNVIRIPMPPENGLYPDNFGDYRTYTNAIFINKTILVPIYEERYDTTALRIWRDALPGYKIAGIDCNSIIPLGGALHCITKAVGVDAPLLISHQPLNNVNFTTIDYEINAFIKHRSGIQTASLFYRTDTTSAYSTVSMSLTHAATQNWTGFIPAQTAGSTVYYFIDAEANSGKRQSRPMPAPAGYWEFDVLQVSSSVDRDLSLIKAGEIYPNPSKGITVVPVETDFPISAKIFVTDVFGKIVENLFDGILKPENDNHFLNTEKWIPGVYFVQYEFEGKGFSEKLIVR